MNDLESAQIREVLRESRKHGKVLARLDERSIHQEERMNRIDRRATGFGAIGGVIAAVIAYMLKSIGWPSA
jgi:hypothetical protein